MTQQQKFPKFNYTENLVKNYNFQVGEIITAKGVIPNLIPTVTPGVPDQPVGSNSEVIFQGRVHKVNNAGEVISVTLLTEINPPSNDQMAYKKDDVVGLHNIQPYYISLVE
ncbi:hypothetical protein [Nostoc sp.]|uniref:hypothetical protein n=1 Tax=Nostoc sp. TaxID=1180 RepID=UPI002FFB5913